MTGETALPSSTPEVSRTIAFSVDIAAPAARVWSALTDPAQIPRWSYMNRCELDSLAVGGTYRFVDPPGPDDSAEIMVLEPNRRLVYRWRSSEPAPTIMEYLLDDHGDYTTLTVRNFPFKQGSDWDRFYEQNFKGWLDFTMQLKSLVEARVGEAVGSSEPGPGS